MSHNFSDDTAGWYLENVDTGAKIRIVNSNALHLTLQKFAPHEHNKWILKWGECAGAPTLDGGPAPTLDNPAERDYVERREHQRVSKKMRIYIISGRRVFRTFCSNISLGGLFLEVAPPRDYSHPDLKIMIENATSGSRMIVKVAFVDGSAQKRIRFLGLQELAQHELSSWIYE